MKRFIPFGASAPALLGLTALLVLAAVGPAQADDRELLREAAGEPYIFILFDTSASMGWSPRCPITTPDPLNPSNTIQVPANPADCALLCPDGDCFVPRQGDDPNSKFYQAKQALYEVIQAVDGVQLGFGTYNQDYLAVRNKHWIYQAANDGPTITGYGAFPATGDQEVFGQTWTCDEGAGDPRTACNPTVPADLDDAWEVSRLRRLPKGHLAFTTTITVYVRYSATIWRLRYIPVGTPTPGASMTMQIERSRCTNASCSTRDLVVTQNVVFNPVAEFLSWDNGAKRANPKQGYFSQAASGDTTGANDCSGWDPNNDHTVPVLAPFLDPPVSGGYNLRWPTDTGDSRGSFFDKGDVLPLDWNNDHKTDILKRLAPNTVNDALALPDFSLSRYFKDRRSTSPAETFLRLKDESERPILALGETPLGASMRNFRQWYSGCQTGTCLPTAGWKGVASVQDADWGCRRKYLLVLTDGDEACSGDPCAAAAALKGSEGVSTYVVAFGFSTGTATLQCMAANGGTGQPYLPENKDELVETLTAIFSQIKEEASSFASAAVPSVQAEVADRIYLSSFTPLNGASVWDGHLDAFLKPLPLDAAGRPDESVDCLSLPESQRSSCHLWDAGEKLEGQAPTAASLAAAAVIDASVLKIGPATDQRRVFYAKAASNTDVPRTLRLFYPPLGDPASDSDWIDLFQGLSLTSGTPAARKARTLNIFRNTLGIKESTIGTDTVNYVFGDVFHSDPVLIDRPNDFFAYASNSHSENGCGYKCFADKQRYRRKMLLVGSNDAQLHFFDAGIWDPDPAVRKFTTGEGIELFSVIPRLLLPAVRELAEKPRHVIGVDGTPRIEDVFLDPIHNGTPTAGERQWRTVVFGGFREGGSPLGAGRINDFVSGYYALDITQPDKVTASGEPQSENDLPDCLSQTNIAVSGCGDLPFPTLLWEFTDSRTGKRWDEDLNDAADLGETWSVPTVGRIKVKNASDQIEERFVAIFGGGMDSANKTSPKSGTWIYMVDVETGQPIYKRRLVGAAAADPAAIDLDVDGFLDVLYIGTTAGFLYKIDISEPAAMTAVTLAKEKGLPDFAADVTVTRVEDPDPAVLSSDSWDPVPIFDTGGKPIYFAPVAFYVASLNRFALAFGTGDREDLWDFEDDVEGRFYLIIDDDYGPVQYAAGTLPLDETQFQLVTPDGSPADPGADYVLNPDTAGGKKAGWYMNLGENERLITQAFGLAGVLIFSSYLPVKGDPDIVDGEVICARTGNSRIFVVYANNADAIMTVDGSKSRYRTVPEFVTNPYVEQGATKNPASSTDDNSENLSAEQLEILKTLKGFFPAGTKFGNYWISVSGIRSDTGYERYATIPIGILERNWKEH